MTNISRKGAKRCQDVFVKTAIQLLILYLIGGLDFFLFSIYWE